MRNTLFASIVSLVLLGPTLLLFAQSAFPDKIPDWLSAADAAYLAGAPSKVDLTDHLNLRDFRDKTLQSAFEDKVDAHIPCKKEALIGSASLQRTAIAFSALPFQWDCYPAFYGSRILCYPEASSLVEPPAIATEAAFGGIRSFAEGLSRSMDRFPGKRVCVFVADRSYGASVNPSMALTSDALSTESVVAELNQAFEGSDNLRAYGTSYDDAASYYQDFYTNDHHWNGYGALRAYRTFADDYGLGALLDDASIEGLEDLATYGSYAREGLDLIDYPPREPSVDLTSLHCEGDDALPVLSADGAAMIRGIGPFAQYNFYESWYGRWGDSVLRNDRISAGNAVVICDSFGSALKYYLATNYAETDVFYDLHSNNERVTSFAERIAASEADTVYIIGCAHNFIQFSERWPSYFQ